MIDGVVDIDDYDVFRFHADAGQTVVFDVLLDAGRHAFRQHAHHPRRARGRARLHRRRLHPEGSVPGLYRRRRRAIISSASPDRPSRSPAFSRARPTAVTGWWQAPCRTCCTRCRPGCGAGARTKCSITGYNLQTIDRVVSGRLAGRRQSRPSRARHARRFRSSSRSSHRSWDVIRCGLSPVRKKRCGKSTSSSPTSKSSSSTRPARATTRSRSRMSDCAERRVRSQEGGPFLCVRRPGRRAPGVRRRFDEARLPRRSLVSLYTTDGKLLASHDDRVQQNGDEPPNLDSYLVYTFEKAGRYIAMIRDCAQTAAIRITSIAWPISPAQARLRPAVAHARADVVSRADRFACRCACGGLAAGRRRSKSGSKIRRRASRGERGRGPAQGHDRQRQLRARPPARRHQHLASHPRGPRHAERAISVAAPRPRRASTARSSSTPPRFCIGGSGWAKSAARSKTRSSSSP